MKPKIVLLAATSALLLSCSCMFLPKNKVTNTQWNCVYTTFVADVGNETTTVSLFFITDKDYLKVTKSVTPSHPAMYMNPDGSVETIPGSSTEYASQGTYSLKKGELTLLEDGVPVMVLMQDAGRLVTKEMDRISGQPLIFSLEREDLAPKKLLEKLKEPKYFHLIGNNRRFGCGFRPTENGARQYYAFYGFPNRNSDYFYNAQISLEEFLEIERKYFTKKYYDGKGEDFYERYVKDHTILLEGEDRIL